MTFLFDSLDALVPYAKQRAMRRLYDGTVDERNMRLIRICRHMLAISPIESAGIIYTRDIGHHESGWWKNPDYERCWHLSISFIANPSDARLPFRPDVAERIARAFWGDDCRKAWIEGPYSPDGKECDVHHYRLFADATWTPILPRREVYSRNNTPKHWRSFSEIHGYKPAREQAPFLLEGQ